MLFMLQKAGIVMLTKVLATEWDQHNIMVNSIDPSFVGPDVTAGLRENERIYSELMDKNPLKSNYGGDSGHGNIPGLR